MTLAETSCTLAENPQNNQNGALIAPKMYKKGIAANFVI
jgi:hypothetical protein